MGRRKIHDDALRIRLLDRAGELLTTEGKEALSVRRLAGDVDTSTTAVYSLFGGKTGLVNALHDEAFRRFGAYLGAVRQGDDPAEDLVRLSIAYRASAQADPNYYRMMFDGTREEVDQELRRRAEETFKPLLHAVQRCIATGVFGQENAASVALALWAHVHGLVSLELGRFVPPEVGAPDEIFEAAVRAAVLGWRRERVSDA